ncbi:MAG TPA: immunoglobulin domain-containing protein, partial [Candidatus Didemnitutus sp.]|nr:immunoglobulin domain-containing protein [Candidatus Didemnitutus sp.]
AGAAGHADGTGAKSRFRSPSGLALDAQGALVLSSGTTLRKGLLARAPVITTQPANATATTGANVTLTAAADGTPAPALQWYFGAQAISGATSGTLTLTNVSPSSAGDYSVSATNDLGSVTSNKATVTVSALSSPPPSSPDPGGAGGGGGGAFSWWFVGMLLVLSSARWTQWRLAARGSIE